MQLPTSSVPLPQPTLAYDRLILTLTDLIDNHQDELRGYVKSVSGLKIALENRNRVGNVIEWEKGLAKLDKCFTKLALLAPRLLKLEEISPSLAKTASNKIQGVWVSLRGSIIYKSSQELQDMFYVEDDESEINGIVDAFENAICWTEGRITDLLDDDRNSPQAVASSTNTPKEGISVSPDPSDPMFSQWKDTKLYLGKGAKFGEDNKGNCHFKATGASLKFSGSAFTGNQVISGSGRTTGNEFRSSNYTPPQPRQYGYHSYASDNTGAVTLARSNPSGGGGLQPLNAQQEREVAEGLVQITPDGIHFNMNGLNADYSSNVNIGSNYTVIIRR